MLAATTAIILQYITLHVPVLPIVAHVAVKVLT